MLKLHSDDFVLPPQWDEDQIDDIRLEHASSKKRSLYIARERKKKQMQQQQSQHLKGSKRPQKQAQAKSAKGGPAAAATSSSSQSSDTSSSSSSDDEDEDEDEDGDAAFRHTRSHGSLPLLPAMPRAKRVGAKPPPPEIAEAASSSQSRSQVKVRDTNSELHELYSYLLRQPSRAGRHADEPPLIEQLDGGYDPELRALEWNWIQTQLECESVEETACESPKADELDLVEWILPDSAIVVLSSSSSSDADSPPAAAAGDRSLTLSEEEAVATLGLELVNEVERRIEEERTVAADEARAKETGVAPMELD